MSFLHSVLPSFLHRLWKFATTIKPAPINHVLPRQNPITTSTHPSHSHPRSKPATTIEPAPTNHVIRPPSKPDQNQHSSITFILSLTLGRAP
mmetsp:Transcript_11957/g.22733  ORF Transcript_11957/g.22733 Transcript_11957/m.22733 type:complete len:92 (+) Transcript_11957:47-322(+)